MQTSSLLEPLLLFSPTVAAVLGLNEAIFIQQLQPKLQFRSHTHDGEHWVHTTMDSWRREFPFWSEQVIEETIQSLNEMEILKITDKYNQAPSDDGLWYSINYSAPKLQVDEQ